MSETSEVADLLIDKVRQDLVDAVQAALAAHDKLIPEHGKYESFLEALVPRTDGFKVDKDKLRDFQDVLRFILITTFGVDGSDGKSQANVRAHLTNRETHPSPNITEIPYLHKLRDGDPIELARVLRLVNMKAESAAREAHHVGEMVERLLREQGGRSRRLRRARGCKNEGCRRGLVRADYDARKNFKDNCTEFQREHLWLEPYPDNDTMTILCPVCQTQERQDEVDEEDRY